ncbi:VOC family protein [Pedobacter sp. Du54]|uniref:VOC family protein n=1 Tax=Pedobacter anseongensis TaxID=3133439 RepID=UPI00309E70EB
MKIRLQEIEFGSTDVEKTKQFYQTIFGFNTAVDQENLTVFTLETHTIDYNISTHLPAKATCISFLTDNLEEIIEKLHKNSIPFDGPQPSHLGMKSISFKDPDGNLLKVNEATNSSPEWLK